MGEEVKTVGVGQRTASSAKGCGEISEELIFELRPE